MAGFGQSDDPPRYVLPPEPHDPARALADSYEARKRAADGRTPPENLLSAAAAVTGEFCIRVAGEFDPNHHDFAPGSLVPSDKIDQMLFADQEDWATLPESTVFGAIRKEALYRGYADSDFPSIAGIRQLLTGEPAKDGDPPTPRGRVPLGVSRDHFPKISPLQDAFMLRKPVTGQLSNWGVPPRAQALTCGRATALMLGRVRNFIEPRIALQIVFATVNGMAKMAPMTARHAAEMQLRVGKSRTVF